MNIKDIPEIEKENKDKIYLFKEGYFYKYFDDFVILGKDQQELKEKEQKINTFLNDKCIYLLT